MSVSDSIPTAPPRERTVVEGNIVEHPIWKLSNRQARPKRLMVDVETGKILTDPETLKPREYVDPTDYTQEFDLGPDPRDGRRRRQLVIKADVHAGFPTVHALRILVVVDEKEVFGYIEEFYNARRRHSAIGYMSPAALEKAARERQAA